MRSEQEYRKRLYSYKPNIFMKGEKVNRDHPQFEPAINIICESYRLAVDPEYQDLFTATSHFTGNKVNRFNYPPRSVEDLLKKQEAILVLSARVGGCAMRCGGGDTLSGLSVLTKEVDEVFKTEYHPRFLKYLQYIQDNDLLTCIHLTDAKGDRSAKAYEQVDRDMYLRIVEKRPDGIVVSGAKLFGASMMLDEITVAPTRAMTDKDGDYAISFSVPADQEGVIIFCKPIAAPTRKHLKAPMATYGVGAENITVFDKVFVPWERVWLCGEWQYAGRAAFLISLFHRSSYTGCKPAMIDIFIGAMALVAEYNRLEKVSHIREKLADMSATRELIHAAGIAGAWKAKPSSAGIYVPDPIYINAGRYHAGVNLYHEFETLADVAGGQGINLPTEEDFLHPEVGHYLQKYVKRSPKVPVEDVWRLFRLVDDLLYSEQAGWYQAAGLHGGGSPILERIAILANYDLEAKKKIVKRLAGIS